MNKLKKIILDNGITLYLRVDPSMKKVFASYNIKYGSSGQWFKFKNNGIEHSVMPGHAHFLEHLLGEHSKFGNMYNNFVLRLQNANAYTSMTETSYHFCGKDDIEKSIRELIEAIDDPVFDKKDVDASRHAIEEEAASYSDETSNKLCNLVSRNLYGGFELYDETLSEIGNRETTKLITVDDLYACYNAFYSDNNKFILISGNVDEQRIIELLNDIYSKIKPHKSSLILPNLDFDSIRRKSEIIIDDVDTSKIGLGIKFKKDKSVSLRELYYVLELICVSFAYSKEFRNLQKKGIFDIYDFDFLEIIDNNVNWSMGFTSKHKKELIGQVLDLLSKRIITPEEYELTRRGLIAEQLRSMEDKYEYLMDFADCISFTEDYSEWEFYKSIDYNRFMEIVSTLNYGSYTVGEVKSLRK